MPHEEKCDCYVCKHGVGEMMAWEIEVMDKYGWYSHQILSGDKKTPTGANIHTHGLETKYKHADLQIVIPLDQKTAQCFLWSLVEEIEKGKKFEAGEVIGGILKGNDITFANATESDRPVLRVIFPDSNGKLDETAEPHYALQWEGTL